MRNRACRRMRRANLVRAAGAAGTGRSRCGTFLAFLLELLADALALHLRQVVDEQFALQVIQLVLDAHREEIGVLDLAYLAGAVMRAQADAGGALDLIE